MEKMETKLNLSEKVKLEINAFDLVILQDLLNRRIERLEELHDDFNLDLDWEKMHVQEMINKLDKLSKKYRQ